MFGSEVLREDRAVELGCRCAKQGHLMVYIYGPNNGGERVYWQWGLKGRQRGGKSLPDVHPIQFRVIL